MRKELSRKLDLDFEPKNCLKACSSTKPTRSNALTEANESEQDISSGNAIKDVYYAGNDKKSALGLSNAKKRNYFTTKILTAVWNN